MSVRIDAVAVATLATTGAGRRCTSRLLPLCSTSGSAACTPCAAAAATAAVTA